MLQDHDHLLDLEGYGSEVPVFRLQRYTSESALDVGLEHRERLLSTQGSAAQAFNTHAVACLQGQ